MKSHSISVAVDGRTISVSPDPLVMTSDDELSWKCSGPQRITVEFDGTGPFESRQLGHDAASRAQRPKQRGRFKYTVSLESDPTVILDPEVVVGDPPSTPHP